METLNFPVIELGTDPDIGLYAIHHSLDEVQAKAVSWPDTSRLFSVDGVEWRYDRDKDDLVLEHEADPTAAVDAVRRMIAQANALIAAAEPRGTVIDEVNGIDGTATDLPGLMAALEAWPWTGVDVPDPDGEIIRNDNGSIIKIIKRIRRKIRR